MAAPNSSISQVLTTTLQKYASSGQLNDAIFEGMKLTKMLKMKNRFQDEDGGETIWISLGYAKNTNVRAMDPYDELITEPQDTMTTASFNWKQIGGTCLMTDREKAQNSGSSRVINLVKAKTDNLVSSCQDNFMTQLNNDGTAANEIVGLRAIITTTGTYGGIARSGNSWWQGNSTAQSALLSIAGMRTMFNTCSHAGIATPDLIYTTQTVFEEYEGLAQSFQLIQKPAMADVGFETLSYKGQPLFWDSYCTSGRMYFLTSKTLTVHQHPQFTWAVDVDRPANQFIDIHTIQWQGALTCNNPRLNGVLTSIT